MATCAVSGVVKDITETAIEGAVIKANIVTPYFTTTIQIVPKEVSTTSSASGAWTLNLNRGASVLITIEYPPNSTDSRLRKTFAATIPAAATADFSTIATDTGA